MRYFSYDCREMRVRVAEPVQACHFTRTLREPWCGATSRLQFRYDQPDCDGRSVHITSCQHGRFEWGKSPMTALLAQWWNESPILETAAIIWSLSAWKGQMGHVRWSIEDTCTFALLSLPRVDISTSTTTCTHTCEHSNRTVILTVSENSSKADMGQTIDSCRGGRSR